MLAGRWIAGIAAVHLVGFTVVSWQHIGGWFGGDLWLAGALTGPMSQSEGYFWALLGSFAVPMLLFGLLITRLRVPLPAFVTWGLTAWLVLCGAVRADRLPVRAGAVRAAHPC